MKVHLIHWKADEAEPRVEQLRVAGHEVAFFPLGNSSTMTHIRASAPQAVVIDLTRMPSHGRAVAAEVRRSPKLRAIPIVFVGGEPEKVAVTRQLFPDATFTEWAAIKGALRKAKPPAAPIVPAGYMEQFAHRPLAQKLGMKPGMKAAVLNAPANFDRAAADFPAEIEWLERPTKAAAMLLLFAESQAQLDAHFGKAAALAIPIWVFWPKQASGKATDLTQQLARTVGHEFGYTDCKVCSFDATWSGFLFRLKRN